MFNTHWSILLLIDLVDRHSMTFSRDIFAYIIDWPKQYTVAAEMLVLDQDNG